jgi:hypothetical protein
VKLRLRLTNSTSVPAILTKLTPLNPDGSRILPAYISENYVSLLAGESREVEVTYPAETAKGTPSIALRGWNLQPTSVTVTITP